MLLLHKEFGYTRLHERRVYPAEITFSFESLFFNALLENVSLGGASVVTKNLPLMKPGCAITVAIPFEKKEGCVKRNALVKWAKEGRFGIQFT